MEASVKPRRGPVRRFFSSLGRGILILMFIGIISGSIVVSVLALFIFNSLDNAPNIDLSSSSQNLSNTSYIYITDPNTGEPKMIHELYSGENREWVEYDKIPQDVIDVTIAAEDKRFNEHHGVDWRRTIISTLTFFTGQRMQGGSTITQQVIKNWTDNDEISPERKIQEIFTALKLEKNYTKEQIMETYLNIAFFSNHCYGIQSASKLYFNKEISELNLAEIATIISITNAPTKFNPFRESRNEDYGWGTGMEENKRRRTYIFDTMLEVGMLTQQERDEWVNYDVQLADRTNAATNSNSTSKLTDWFTDQVIEDVQADLVEKLNYTPSAASQLLFNGGYRIYSTMDEAIQKALEDAYANPDTFPKVLNAEYPETAFIIIAPDGSVKGMIGGNKKTVNRGFNRATMAVRHPGSTIKPISAYLNAFEQDLITWSTTFEDSPITIVEDGQTREWPMNYTNTYTRAPMTVQYALQQSVNTIPAKLVNIMTPQVCYKTLKDKFQISTLDPMDEVSKSAMALGGMTYGMKPIELVGCYQIFVTGGKYVKPYTYTKVTDMEGNIILEKDTAQVQVVSEETATVLNRLLQTVASSGTGAASNLAYTSVKMPTAGKTGSSTGTKVVNGTLVDIDNPDLWYIGLTPYYIGGVWMGYDEKEEIRYGTYPTPILWKNLMLPIHEGLPEKDFEYSDKVQALQYCKLSGDLATEYCTSTGYGWYKDTYIPSPCVLCRGGSDTADTTDDSTTDTTDPKPSDSGGKKVIINPKNKNQPDSSGSSSSSSSSSKKKESTDDSSFWDKFFQD